MSSNKMANSYLHFIPAAVFVLLPATFVITYFWSVKENHVYPVLPNISETGALPPESCLFGMMLNLTAFAMLFTVYVRHKEIVEVFRAKDIEKTIPHAFMINRVSTITGIVACGSLDLTANFQEVSAMAWIHRIAAVICFYSSAMYLIQQAVLTAWMVPEISGVWLVHVRWFLGGVAVVTVLTETVTTTTSFALLAMEGNATHKMSSNHVSHWTPDMPGYSWHCLSSALQWITVSALGTYILTLYWDFKKISIFEPEVEIAEDPIPEPVQPKGFRRANYAHE